MVANGRIERPHLTQGCVLQRLRHALAQESGEIACFGEVFEAGKRLRRRGIIRLCLRERQIGVLRVNLGLRLRRRLLLLRGWSFGLAHRLLPARPAGEEIFVPVAHLLGGRIARTSGSARSRLRLTKGRST